MKKKWLIISAALAVLLLGGWLISIIIQTEKAWRLSYRQVTGRVVPLDVRARRIDEPGRGELLLSSKLVYDIEYFPPNYYVATSGGIRVLDENFRELRVISSREGLNEVQVKKVIRTESGLLLLYRNGSWGMFHPPFISNYRTDGIVIRDALRLNGRLILASADAIYEQQDRELKRLFQFNGIKRIFGRQRLYVIGQDNHIYKAAALFQRLDEGEPTFVDNAKELNGSVWVASVQGLRELPSGRTLFDRQPIKDCELFANQIVALSGSGEILSPERTVRLISERATLFQLKNVNDLLFALSSDGLFMFDQRTWKEIRLGGDLPDPFITTLCGGPEGIWCGTLENGLFDTGGTTVGGLTEAQSEVNDSILFGRTPCWATNAGILTLTNRQATPLSGSENIQVNALLADGDTLWAGSGRGLLRWRDSRLELFNWLQKLPNNRIFCLAKTEAGIWCGTMAGICLFDGAGFSVQIGSFNSEIKDNWISNLLASDDGVLYFTTYNGEFGRLSGQTAEILDRRPLKFNINTLVADGDYLFCGSYGQGIWICNRRTQEVRFWQRDMPSTNVTDLLVMGGRLMAATDSGIWSTDLADLLAELKW